MKVTEGKLSGSYLITIYGVPGCGKTTLASYAESPVFLNMEGGTDRIDCARYQHDSWDEDRTKFETAEEVEVALAELINIADFKTIVIDGIGAWEELLIKEILDKNRVSSLSDLAYGKGYDLLRQRWIRALALLADVKDSGKNVICVGHEMIEKVESPTGDNFDRYTLAINKKVATSFLARMDGVFFAQYDRVFKSRSDNDDKKLAIETSPGARVLITAEKPHCIAKNRFTMPERVSFKEESDRKQFFEFLN